jgi:hypothetical protein
LVAVLVAVRFQLFCFLLRHIATQNVRVSVCK